MKRREFIGFLGRAAASWPLGAAAQQPNIPMVGYLSTRSLADSVNIVAAFRKGLNEVGYSEGRNVMIKWRFAEGHYDRLQALVADLVRRQVVAENNVAPDPAIGSFSRGFRIRDPTHHRYALV